jgi:hypothetical protein
MRYQNCVADWSHVSTPRLLDRVRLACFLNSSSPMVYLDAVLEGLGCCPVSIRLMGGVNLVDR